jgi:hypothetical protein
MRPRQYWGEEIELASLFQCSDLHIKSTLTRCHKSSRMVLSVRNFSAGGTGKRRKARRQMLPWRLVGISPANVVSATSGAIARVNRTPGVSIIGGNIDQGPVAPVTDVKGGVEQMGLGSRILMDLGQLGRVDDALSWSVLHDILVQLFLGKLRHSAIDGSEIGQEQRRIVLL